MKNSFLFTAVILFLFFTSCKKEDAPGVPGMLNVITTDSVSSFYSQGNLMQPYADTSYFQLGFLTMKYTYTDINTGEAVKIKMTNTIPIVHVQLQFVASAGSFCQCGGWSTSTTYNGISDSLMWIIPSYE